MDNGIVEYDIHPSILLDLMGWLIDQTRFFCGWRTHFGIQTEGTGLPLCLGRLDFRGAVRVKLNFKSKI